MDFAGNLFGFYLQTPGGYWYSQSALNSDQADHMLAFAGQNDWVQLPSSPAGKWDPNEFVLAWEDLARPGWDYDYNDFVVMVESVHAERAGAGQPGSLRRWASQRSAGHSVDALCRPRFEQQLQQLIRQEEQESEQEGESPEGTLRQRPKLQRPHPGGAFFFALDKTRQPEGCLEKRHIASLAGESPAGNPDLIRRLTGWRLAVRSRSIPQPHFESPQLRQVMQPSIMITAAVLHFEHSCAPSG